MTDRVHFDLLPFLVKPGDEPPISDAQLPHYIITARPLERTHGVSQALFQFLQDPRSY